LQKRKVFMTNNINKNYDVVILGSGPAGLTAGIYASRAKLKTLILDGPQPGGQLMTTTAVENWPGEESIQGPDLMMKMRGQAEKCGAEFLMESVIKTDLQSSEFTFETDGKKTITGKAVIIATGATAKRLGCPGESEYWAKGVSTCATCDAPFFEGKEIVIIGGGDTAMTEAEHMTHFASKITVVHILDELTGKDPIKDKVLDNPKVNFIYSSTVTEIKGDGSNVIGVVIENQKDKTTQELPAQGVFVAIGYKPNTDMFKSQLDMDDYGYLKLKDHSRTNIEGVFAAGDVADYRYRQAVTSAGVGCMAALDAQSYLSKKS